MSQENNFCLRQPNMFSYRDKLVSPVIDAFRFTGDGYIVLDRQRFRPSKASMVSLKFKTYADNGLIFFAGEGRDFMSLELVDGKIVFQYDLGSGRAKLESTERYNDGNWHTVVANRLRQDGLLKVDSVTGKALSKYLAFH